MSLVCGTHFGVLRSPADRTNLSAEQAYETALGECA